MATDQKLDSATACGRGHEDTRPVFADLAYSHLNVLHIHNHIPISKLHQIIISYYYHFTTIIQVNLH